MVVLCNLKPRNMRGVKSNGMVRSKAPPCAICLMSVSLLRELDAVCIQPPRCALQWGLRNERAASWRGNRTHVHVGPVCVPLLVVWELAHMLLMFSTAGGLHTSH